MSDDLNTSDRYRGTDDETGEALLACERCGETWPESRFGEGCCPDCQDERPPVARTTTIAGEKVTVEQCGDCGVWIPVGQDHTQERCDELAETREVRERAHRTVGCQ